MYIDIIYFINANASANAKSSTSGAVFTRMQVTRLIRSVLYLVEGDDQPTRRALSTVLSHDR